MTEVTAKEMIALIDEDIKLALMAGDNEFVGYLKEEKGKILDTEYPTRHKEYVELFGKQPIFLLTKPVGCVILYT